MPGGFLRRVPVVGGAVASGVDSNNPRYQYSLNRQQLEAAAAKKAVELSARCPNDGTLAKPGTKFCPECGAQMIQPTVDACPQCGTPTASAKFCPNCGTKIERAPASTTCPNCGADAKGAKFCPECGPKLGYNTAYTNLVARKKVSQNLWDFSV